MVGKVETCACGVLCDHRLWLQLKGHFFKTTIELISCMDLNVGQRRSEKRKYMLLPCMY